MAKKKKKKRVPPRVESLKRHQSGDRHAALGFQYECAWRCLWMLRSRRDDYSLQVSNGEDCKLVFADDRHIYRQVKKKDGDKWYFSDRSFKDFLRRAYDRFKDNPSVRHEFYTNAPIDRRIVKTTGGDTILDCNNEQVATFVPANKEIFCSSVILKDQKGQAEPERMRNEVIAELRRIIDSAFAGPFASDLVVHSELSDMAARLLSAEFRLFNGDAPVTWKDVDREVALESLLRKIDLHANLGGAVQSWEQIARTPTECLPTDAAEAYKAVIVNQSISRHTSEDEILELISQWKASFVADSKGSSSFHSPRLLLIIGPHGSGRTWSLIRIGTRVSEENSDLHVAFASGPPRDMKELQRLGLSSRSPIVLLIDELWVGWDYFMTLPRAYLPNNVLFIASASSDVDAPEVDQLREELQKELHITELTPTLQDFELNDLSLKLRGIGITANELRAARKTNIRQAVRVLLKKRPDLGFGELKRLVEDDAFLLKSLAPILICSHLGVSLPLEILERSLHRALPGRLRPWLLRRHRNDQSLIDFENFDDAKRLLDYFYSSSLDEIIRFHLENLIEECMVQNSEDQAFLRQLCSRISRRDSILANQLFESKRRNLEKFLREESLVSIAYTWLPTFERAGSDELIRVAALSAPHAPRDSTEFVLWLRVNSVRRAAKYLRERIHALPSWDVPLICSVAEMINVIRNEDRKLARSFCSLLIQLPMDTLYNCLLHRTSFSLVTALLAHAGNAKARIKGLQIIGGLIVERLRYDGWVPQPWIESYLGLLDRTFSQSRHGLAFTIRRDLVAGGARGGTADDEYRSLFEREQDFYSQPLIEISIRRLEDCMENSDQAVDGSFIPSNLLGLSVTWADDSQWKDLLDHYLRALEGVARRTIPVGRISAILFPAFGVIGSRGPRSLQERFLKVALTWAPREGLIATETNTEFLFKCIHFAARLPWLPDELRESAKHFFLNLLADSAEGCACGRSVLNQLTLRFHLEPVRLDNSLGIIPEWYDKGNLAGVYINYATTFLVWSDEEREVLAAQLMRHWCEVKEIQADLIAGILRLEHLEQAFKLSQQLLEHRPGFPDGYGLQAVALAKRADVDGAYKLLRKITDIWEQERKGLSPWLARWIHRELIPVTDGLPRYLHILCVELNSGQRLRTLQDLTG